MEDKYYYESDDSEIDIAEICRKLWSDRKAIIKITAVCFALGLFFALFSPKQYTSTCMFVPQSNVSSGSKFSSLASLIGVDLDMTGNDGPLNPRVYPYILDNSDYMLDLMNTPVHFSCYPEPVTLFDYYSDPQYHKFNLVSTLKKYTIGLPGLIVNSLRKSDDSVPALFSIDTAGKVRHLSAEEGKVARAIASSLEIEVNAKEGFLTMTAEMPDALASAELCQCAFDLLKQYVSAFKVQKSQSQLSYVEAQCNEAKAEYELKQQQYARFVDSHQGQMTAVADVERSRLASEAELARSLYSELARNLATVKVKVNEDAIAFTDVAPVTVPDRASKPRRMMLVAIWTFLGLCIGCMGTYYKNELKVKGDQRQQ